MQHMLLVTSLLMAATYLMKIAEAFASFSYYNYRQPLQQQQSNDDNYYGSFDSSLLLFVNSVSMINLKILSHLHPSHCLTVQKAL